MKPIANIVHAEPYEKGGEKKYKYTTVGTLLKNDKGVSIKLNSIPVSFNGWLNCYPLKDGEGNAITDLDDDLPF